MPAHLTDAELTDLAEGLRAEASAPHLRACGGCRRRLGDLRAAISLASGLDVPEPSPLFWDHLSARISEQVAAASSGGVGWLPGRWSPRRAVPAVVGIAAVVLAFAAGAMLIGPHHLGHVGTGASTSAPLAVVAGLMTDADAQGDDAALSVRPGTLDGAVASLSVRERATLARLMAEEVDAKP